MGGAFGNLLGFHSSENCQPARHSSANINNYQHVGSQIAVFAIPPKCLANQTLSLPFRQNVWRIKPVGEVVQNKLRDII